MTPIVNAISAAPVFWLIMAALVVVVAGLGFLSTGSHDYPQRNPGDDLAEYRDHELDERLSREWQQRHAAQAPRRRGQELPPIESIGFRSLDDIRRDYNRKDGAA